MLSPSGRYVMVFNGEIYNYRALAERYRIQEREMKSTSDSEVLVHVIDKVGVAKLASELNGMFAIVVLDQQRELIHMIRDFAGIKPLFYGLHPNGLVFASQFDQIFHHPWFEKSRTLRDDIMKEYFSLGYMPAPNTIFKHIYQLRPGEIITWSMAENAVVNRGMIMSWNEFDGMDETSAQCTQKFEDCLSAIVRDQLHADVPVATFLSGGVDSPIVTAFAHRHNKSIRSFTVGIEHKLVDETEMARRYAQALSVDASFELYSSDDIASEVNGHFHGMLEPFGDYSSLPTFFITKRAKQFATVMLSGDGGDEMFWGYPRMLTQVSNAGWFRLPMLLRNPLVKIRRASGKNLSYALDNINDFSDWTLNFQSRFTTQRLQALIPDVKFSAETSALYRYEGSLSSEVALLRWLRHNEFYGHLQRVLRKVDLASMANSLEVRVPFLDKRCIEFSNSITPQLGSIHTEPKYILKQALLKLIPGVAINTEKRGFGIPINEYLRGRLKSDLVSNCLDREFFGDQHVSVTAVRKYVLDFLDMRHDNGWGVWHLYAWQKWAAIHLGK